MAPEAGLKLVASSVGTMSGIAGDLLRGAGERLIEPLRQRPAIATPERPRPMRTAPAGRIELCDLTFAYPSRVGHMG